MTRVHLLPALALLTGTLAATPAAQSAAQSTSIRGAAHGLTVSPAGIVAAGPGWKARFEPGRVEVTPALGRQVPASRPLAFSLESVWIGGEPVHAVLAPVEPEAAGDLVRYRHAGGLEERYEVRRDGIEQSFLVTELPSREGELVVRGRIETSLAPVPAAGGGLTFAREGRAELGGVRVGAVTGVDATGRTVPGSLCVDGDVLELVLPAEFVATAELPLLVDPLIGGAIDWSSPSADEQAPDVAYDATTDRFLVVWEEAFSATDVDLRGQLLDSNGALIGGVIVVTSNSGLTISPSVASVSSSDRFLVAYQYATSFLGPWRIRVTAVDAATGTLPGSFTLIASSPTTSHESPAVGGRAIPSGDEVIVVWEEVDVGIRAQLVDVPAFGTPLPSGPSVLLEAHPDVERPAITRSGGPSDIFVVGYQKLFPGPSGGDYDAQFKAIDLGLNVLHTALLPAIGTDEVEVAVDGNGTDFLGVFQQEVQAGNEDISSLTMRWDGAVLSTVFNTTLGAASTDDFVPCVSWSGAEFLVAWEDRTGPFLDSEVRAVWVDSGSGTQQDPTVEVLGSGSHSGGPAIASRYHGTAVSLGWTGDEALLVYERAKTTLPFDSDVTAQLFEAVGAGGAVIDQGGGCGTGGAASTNGPFAIGNSQFGVWVTGADPSATFALLSLTAGGVPSGCGPCNFLPPVLTYSQPVLAGDAFQALPIPNQGSYLGAGIEAQWAVLPTGSTPCPLFAGVAMSNRLQLTFGL